MDLKSTDKGFLPPRMTTTQMNSITSPSAGLMVYSTTVNSLCFYNGSSWKITDDSDGESCGTITYDGQTYETVIIGTQCWMAENLNIGLAILGSSNQTDNSIIEKYCYNNESDSCDVYGGLYQWDEMMQYVTTVGTQGICPDGWHLSSDGEWTTLTEYLGGTSVAGEKMKSTSGWINNGNGTNTSGFTGLPGGYHNGSVPFINLGYSGYWWSSSEHSGTNAWRWRMYYSADLVTRYSYPKTYGLSVRCLKD